METTKKTFLFVFALLVLTIPAYAGQVTSDQAFGKACQFMKDKTFKMASSMRRSQGQLGNTAASPFFVFNATEGGYVVVSGDDRTRDILGYSTTGTLDMDNLPDNLKWWLEEYARQIEALDGGTLAATMSTEPLSMSAIAPLINTTWNQYAPYNYMCPDGSGRDYYESGYNANNRCITGCVATAMAQVMNYWQWPETCPALEAYKTERFSVKSLSPTTFEWYLMKNSYSSSETGEAANAVAKLMRYCGQAVNMNYGVTESAGGVSKEVMVKIFNYSHNIQYVRRDDYSTDSWEQLIYKELSAGRPVLYSGHSDNGGHEFVIDGYSSNGLFHINWGWGGYCDNYFVLSVADSSRPGVNGKYSSGGFRFYQDALIGIKPHREGEIEPYVALSNDSLTATFYYDGHMVSRNGVAIGSDYYYETPAYTTATNIIIDESFANYSPSSTAFWFYECKNLQAITGLSNLNTDNVTDMRYMFNGCSKLTSLDFSNFKTDNVTSMNSMFSGCSSLTSLDLSNFKTDNVTNMSEIFVGCSNLTSLDVSNFKTDNVTSMGYMFYDCSSLTDLDLSSFITENVTSMSSMFNSCSSLTSIYVGDGWSTDNVESGNYMFSGCYKLIGGKGTIYKYSNTDFTYAHIDGGYDNPGYFSVPGQEPPPLFYAYLNNDSTIVTFCYDNQKKARGGIDINNTYLSWKEKSPYGKVITAIFDASVAEYRPTSTAYWFQKCSQLTNIIGLENVNTGYVTSMNYMFYGCSSLTSLDVSNFKTDSVKYMDYMFYGCSSLTDLDLSSFITENVTSMSSMFYRCSNLTSIYVGNGWSTDNVKSGNHLFSECNKLIGGKGTTYNYSHTDFTYAHIDGGYDNPGYFSVPGQEPPPLFYAYLNNDSTIVTFCYDNQKKARGGININNTYLLWGEKSPYGKAVTAIFDASVAEYRPTRTACWFMECPRLTNIIGLENVNTGYVTSMEYMFYGCSSLTDLDVSNFKTDSVKYMDYMFYGCSSLTSLNLSNFKTDKVTGMSSMFSRCYKLTSLNLSNFKTDSVTSMAYMFYGCNKLASLNLCTFNTEKVTNMNCMFYNCTDLTTIFVGDGWSTASVASGENMFYNCKHLVGGQGSLYNGDYYEYSYTDYSFARIDGGIESPGYFSILGQELPDVPYAVLSENNTLLTFYYDNKKNERNGMSVIPTDSYPEWMSQSKSVVTVIFDASFANCTAINSTSLWFYDMNNLTTISGIENLKTDKVTNMEGMFMNCSSLTSLNLSSFNTDSLKYIKSMFTGCSSLTSIDISNFKTEKVKYLARVFEYCSSLTSLDLSSFNTENVTSMYRMFCGCYKLTTIYVSDKWSSANVTNGTDMFSGCSRLVGGQGSKYYYSHTDHTYAHIDGGEESPGYLTRKTDTGIKGIWMDNDMVKSPAYNLGGQRMASPQKGINIVNGRKIIMK